MGKSLRSKKMKRKRSEKREKLDNWEKKNVNELYEKMKQLIEAPAPPPQRAFQPPFPASPPISQSSSEINL